MKYTPPARIDLTPDESAQYEKILAATPESRDWVPIANAMESLFGSLQGRNAFPEIRLRVFADPELGEQRGRSPQQVFGSNGTSGREIIRHPHFIPYLRYFVEGPDLPAPVIQGFCKVLSEDRGTSGMVMDQLRAFARKTVREHQLSHHAAATAFYRLSLEVGAEQWARTVRDAAMSAR